MFKSMFKRAWLSISRKLSKTMILMIVMFVMANLVLASIAIKNAVKESTKFAKESLGSTVYLTADMDKIREEATNNMEQSRGNGQVRMMIQRPTIYSDMVKSIAESKYVKDYTYGINATAKESGFDVIESSSNSGPSLSMGGGRAIGMYGNISVMGINSYAFITEVSNKTMELIEGTYFDENTFGKAIISSELAELNSLKLGDVIKLINEEIDMENYDFRSGSDPKVKSSETYELEVIGIYEVNTDNFNANAIYMNVETAAQFLKENSFNNGNYGVDNVTYFLNNPDDANAFIKEAENKFPNLKDSNLKLDINSEDYDKMAGPIEQVGGFSNTVLWIVIVASILIITLIINNNIKDRKYEIGVLMSLGGTKKNIVGSFLIELIIIGTIGFLLSIGTSYFLADSMGKSLLKNQLQIKEEETENNFGRPTTREMRGGMQRGEMNIIGIPNNSTVDTIDSIDISVSIEDYIILFLIGYLIAGVAMIIPSINIVKYEPKTILTGRQ